MLKPLRLLLIEDSPDDAEILLRILLREGYEVSCERVETALDMKAALATGNWDIVISDFSLPRFSGTGAFDVLRASGLDLPFIVISGAVGEEAAVALLKAGVHDFLIKGRLARLAAVIEREIHDARKRAEHRKAQAALLHSETRFRQIVETAREGIWVTDGNGATRYANERMAELLGCTMDQMNGARIGNHVLGDAGASVAACLLQASSAELLEVEFRRMDGREFVARLSMNSFPGEPGEGTNALFMVTDTTEQRNLTAQVVVADRMSSLGILAAGVAHEINSPLTAIVGNLDLFERTVNIMPVAVQRSLEGHKALQYMAHAREASEQVRDIVRDLRIYTRTEDVAPAPMELRSAIEPAIRMAWHEIRDRALLTCDYQANPIVIGTRSRLSQVFLNLLINAAQALPTDNRENNRIHVRVSIDARGAAIVEVQDNGIGMSPSVVSRLFTPFFTTKESGIGTGLGLSITYRILKALNGSITVDTAPGAGSVFRVLLPALP